MIAVARQFLERVQLSGQEVGAFNALQEWLTMLEKNDVSQTSVEKSVTKK